VKVLLYIFFLSNMRRD